MERLSHKNKSRLEGKLYRLGREIRERGVSSYKKHGSFWDLTLPNGIRFHHDDYNHAVHVFFQNGYKRYFGMNFGGFVIRVSEDELDRAIDAVTLTNYEAV